MLVGAQNEVLAEVPERLTGFEELQLTLVSRRRAGLDAPASTTTRTGRSARAGRVVTGMVAGRGGAVGATIARRAGGARARPCTQKAIDLTYWLPRCPAGSVRRTPLIKRQSSDGPHSLNRRLIRISC